MEKDIGEKLIEEKSDPVEDAFKQMGGFGKVQKVSYVMNTLAQGSASFFVSCLVFLEKMPLLECNINDEWDTCMKETYCKLEDDLRRVNWKSPESIPNFIDQVDFYCSPEYMIGLVGASFVCGIVVGSVTLTRLGDIYGRKPTYMGGLLMHLSSTILFLVC